MASGVMPPAILMMASFCMASILYVPFFVLFDILPLLVEAVAGQFLLLFLPWLGIPIFGSNFWDHHCKRNSDSVFNSEDSSWIFFEILMSGESENWNSDLQYSEFR